MHEQPRPAGAEPSVPSESRVPARPAASGRPYGLIGLTVGFVLIIAAAVLLCCVATAGAFGVAALILGRGVTSRLADLQAALTRGDANAGQALVVTLSLLFYAAIAAAVLAAARLRGGTLWRDVIGWHGWSPYRRSRLFWCVAVGAILYNIIVDKAISRAYPPSKAWVVVPQQPLWAALFFGLVIVFAPIAEELLFRGWLYTGLRAKTGVVLANTISAALFALAHWEETHLYALAVFPVGLALGFIRERSASLKASMAFHALFNAAASAFLIFLP